MIFFGLRRIARPAVGDTIIVGVIGRYEYAKTDGRFQRSKNIVFEGGGNTEFRETTELRDVLGSHIYREPIVPVQSSL
jgi:hypothetical protein